MFAVCSREAILGDLLERANSKLGVSPMEELGAYEALWEEDGTSFKSVADIVRKDPNVRPSDIVPVSKSKDALHRVMDRFRTAGVGRFGIRLNGTADYPVRLRDAAHPLEFLYYQGWWDLVETPSVAVVGTRSPSEEGVRRARKLVRELVKHGYTVASGLAEGIDSVAHETALAEGGETFAVIGTPISEAYPKKNAALQKRMSEEHLVISQVPVLRYARQNPRFNRFFFPERNVTMSALTMATVIVEAGETSGTLIQARAALHQGRDVFILESNFQRPELTWPHKFLERGAKRVRDFDEIRMRLDALATESGRPDPAGSQLPTAH
jgi:DNA processing protein